MFFQGRALWMVTISLAGVPPLDTWTKHHKKAASALARHVLRDVGVESTDIRLPGRITMTTRRMCTPAERSTVREPHCAAEWRLR